AKAKVQRGCLTTDARGAATEVGKGAQGVGITSARQTRSTQEEGQTKRRRASSHCRRTEEALGRQEGWHAIGRGQESRPLEAGADKPPAQARRGRKNGAKEDGPGSRASFRRMTNGTGHRAVPQRSLSAFASGRLQAARHFPTRDQYYRAL